MMWEFAKVVVYVWILALRNSLETKNGCYFVDFPNFLVLVEAYIWCLSKRIVIFDVIPRSSKWNVTFSFQLVRRLRKDFYSICSYSTLQKLPPSYILFHLQPFKSGCCYNTNLPRVVAAAAQILWLILKNLLQISMFYFYFLFH